MKLKRRRLKTIRKGSARPPDGPDELDPHPHAPGQDVGAPKVDTFARDTLPNVVYTLRMKGR